MTSISTIEDIVERGTSGGLEMGEAQRRLDEFEAEEMHVEAGDKEEAKAIDWLLEDCREKGLRQREDVSKR